MPERKIPNYIKISYLQKSVRIFFILCYNKRRDLGGREMKVLTAWRALALRSSEMARHLEKKQFTPEKEWGQYQTVAYRLMKQFATLSADSAQLDQKAIGPLKNLCQTALKTIQVRLSHFDPEKNTEVKKQLYEAQRQHYEKRLSSLERKRADIEVTRQVHGTLMTPRLKADEVEAEIELIKNHLANIRRQERLLH